MQKRLSRFEKDMFVETMDTMEDLNNKCERLLEHHRDSILGNEGDENMHGETCPEEVHSFDLVLDVVGGMKETQPKRRRTSSNCGASSIKPFISVRNLLFNQKYIN